MSLWLPFWKLDIDSPLILKNLLGFGIRKLPIKLEMWFSKYKSPELLVKFYSKNVMKIGKG